MYDYSSVSSSYRRDCRYSVTTFLARNWKCSNCTSNMSLNYKPISMIKFRRVHGVRRDSFQKLGTFVPGNVEGGRESALTTKRRGEHRKAERLDEEAFLLPPPPSASSTRIFSRFTYSLLVALSFLGSDCKLLAIRVSYVCRGDCSPGWPVNSTSQYPDRGVNGEEVSLSLFHCSGR